MVIVSSSLVNSTPFVVRRREEEDARTRIWLEHGDTVVIDGLAQEGVRSAFPVLAGPRTNFTFQPRAQHLPNFVQLLDSGACCHLALKVRPCWTSVRERKDNIGALLVEVFSIGEAVSR